MLSALAVFCCVEVTQDEEGDFVEEKLDNRELVAQDIAKDLVKNLITSIENPEISKIQKSEEAEPEYEFHNSSNGEKIDILAKDERTITLWLPNYNLLCKVNKAHLDKLKKGEMNSIDGKLAFKEEEKLLPFYDSFFEFNDGNLTKIPPFEAKISCSEGKFSVNVSVDESIKGKISELENSVKDLKIDSNKEKFKKAIDYFICIRDTLSLTLVPVFMGRIKAIKELVDSDNAFDDIQEKFKVFYGLCLLSCKCFPLYTDENYFVTDGKKFSDIKGFKLETKSDMRKRQRYLSKIEVEYNNN